MDLIRQSALIIPTESRDNQDIGRAGVFCGLTKFRPTWIISV